MLNFFKRLFVGACFGITIALSATLAVPVFQDGFIQVAEAHKPPFEPRRPMRVAQAQEDPWDAVAKEGMPNKEETEPKLSLVSAQVIQETPGPIPQTNLSVRIIGQRDGLVGDLMYFSLEITGVPDSVQWSLDPPVHGFHVLDGRRNAVFSNRDTGEYEVYVSIGGEKQVAHDKFKFAIEQGQLPQPEPADPTHQQFMPMQQQMPMGQQMMQPGMTDWKGGIKSLAMRVASNTRGQEGITLAGCFREVANELRVGTFSGADPWVETDKQAREALGADYPPWQVFFRDLGYVLLNLHQRGVSNTPQQNILLLEGAAEGLGDLE